MRRRIMLMFSGLLFLLLVALVFAQGRVDPEPSAQPRPAIIGLDMQDMSWSEIAAMLAVLAGVWTFTQWLLTRSIIQPQIQAANKKIEESIDNATQEIMKACMDQFLSKYKFDLHQSEDILNHKALNEAMQHIVENQETDAERLTDARERLRVLESHRRRNEP